MPKIKKIKVIKKICLYCGCEAMRLNRENVCTKCKDENDEEIDEDNNDYTCCDSCGRDVHQDDSYNVNGDTGCENCVTYCDKCEEYHWNDDVSRCEICSSSTCEPYECEKCGKTLCEDCSKSCDCCGNYLCKDCKKVYEGEDLCEDCVNNKKEEKVEENNDTKKQVTISERRKVGEFRIGEKVKLLEDNCGYKKEDIAIIKKRHNDGYELFVQGRKSSSGLKPNVWYPKEQLELVKQMEEKKDDRKENHKT